MGLEIVQADRYFLVSLAVIYTQNEHIQEEAQTVLVHRIDSSEIRNTEKQSSSFHCDWLISKSGFIDTSLCLFRFLLLS